MKNSNYIWGGIMIAIVIAIIALYTPVASKVAKLGGTTNYDTLGASAIKVGSGCNDSYGSCTGSTISQLNMGTCYIQPYAATVAASSTALVSCQGTKAWNAAGLNGSSALPGVQKDDAVQVTLSTTTAGDTKMGLTVIGASASTTSGYITLRVANLTGTTYTWTVGTGLASGTASYISSR